MTITKPRHQWLRSCAIGLTVLIAVTPLGCSVDPSEERIEFNVKVESTDLTKSTTNLEGWEVTVASARVHVAALYFYGLDPADSELSPFGAPFAAVWDTLVPNAYAHPGHGETNQSNVQAEWLNSFVLDLPGAVVDLAPVPGLKGHAESVALLLRSGDKGAAAEVTGHATKGDTTIRFRGELSLPGSPAERRTAPIDIHADIESGSVVTLKLDPRTWFHEMPFEFLLDGSGECLVDAGDGYCGFTPDTVAANSWASELLGDEGVTGSIPGPPSAHQD